jgi:hypothetical protein
MLMPILTLQMGDDWSAYFNLTTAGWTVFLLFSFIRLFSHIAQIRGTFLREFSLIFRSNSLAWSTNGIHINAHQIG